MKNLIPTPSLKVISIGIVLGQCIASAQADFSHLIARRDLKLSLPTQVARPTPRLVVTLPRGINPNKFANTYAVKLVGEMVVPANTYIYNAGTISNAERLINRLKNTDMNPVMDSIMPIIRDAFVPNDSLYPINSPVAPWPGQWYLKKTGAALVDINIVPAWNLDFTGSGVVIGLIDDGFEITHPDLTTNYSATNAFDFGQSDSNPSPVTSLDVHGTAMAGTIAARGGNSVGITGVSPFALWTGLRVDFDGTESAFASQTANATSFRSSSTVTTIKIKNHSYSLSSPFVSATLQTTALSSSALAGTIHVHSAGNGRGSSTEDVNKQAEKAQTPVIVASAMDSLGKFLPSSSFGAHVAVCVPTYDASVAGTLSFVTTDRTTEGNGYNGGGDTFPSSDYTSLGGYTSSAAALVSGAMGVIKQAQPILDTRFAKHMLARTSTQVDLADVSVESDGSWKTNQAGFKHNQNYGWGLLNVGSMTTEATKWAGTTSLISAGSGSVNVSALIPDGVLTGITRTFTFAGTSTPLEEVQLGLTATHAYRGDLEAYVTSPGGTTSRMFIQAGSDDGDNINWTFTSLAFWGENPVGVWSVKVVDTFPVDSGTWNNYSLNFRQGQLYRNFSGNVVLEDWIGPVAGQTVNLEFRPVGVGASIFKVVTLDASGNFSFTHQFSGNYDIFAKKSHWLQKLNSNMNFSVANGSSGTFSLINGDINGDNFVGFDDFDILSAAFGLSLGDPGYVINADLNGDDFIGFDDFDILSANFGLNGDE